MGGQTQTTQDWRGSAPGLLQDWALLGQRQRHCGASFHYMGGRQTEHKASTGESQIENIKRLLMHDPTHHVAQTQLESPISAGSAFPFGLRYFESLYLHPRVLVRVVSKEKQFQVASALHTQYQSRQNYVVHKISKCPRWIFPSV